MKVNTIQTGEIDQMRQWQAAFERAHYIRTLQSYDRRITQVRRERGR